MTTATQRENLDKAVESLIFGRHGDFGLKFADIRNSIPVTSNLFFATASPERIEMELDRSIQRLRKRGRITFRQGAWFPKACAVEAAA